MALRVEDLVLYFNTTRGVVKAVDGVSFEVDRGETLAIVGESGSGKSSTAFALMRLLPRNTYRYGGRIWIDGEETSALPDEEFRRRVRWRKISMVFQAAMNALNPVKKVGEQIAEPLMVHLGVGREEALRAAAESLRDVGLSPEVAQRYPFELSGGMKQRVVIAMALVTKPTIVILDEPTSALDVITQANIMNLLKRLKRDHGLSYIFITHDIALASELADKIGVMYAGQLIEVAPAEEFFGRPLHPYSRMLINAIPTLRSDKSLGFIPGDVPSLIDVPAGCRFHPRCPFTLNTCRREQPRRIRRDGHHVSCWLYD